MKKLIIILILIFSNYIYADQALVKRELDRMQMYNALEFVLRMGFPDVWGTNEKDWYKIVYNELHEWDEVFRLEVIVYGDFIVKYEVVFWESRKKNEL